MSDNDKENKDKNEKRKEEQPDLNVLDFGAFRGKQEKTLDGFSVLQGVVELAEAGLLEKAVVVVRLTDGTISVGWSEMELTQAIGLLQVGSASIVDQMRAGMEE